MKKQVVYLPVTKHKLPDWDFMDTYISSIDKEKSDKYDSYLKKILKGIKYTKIEKLEDKTWKGFTIEEIFEVESGVRLTKDNMIAGDRPFIGSTEANNGITNFVSNTNESIDSNVLGVNYNGSVGESFYHPYECIFSDDVKRLIFKNHEGNKYIYLFFSGLIHKQKAKYTYGYKFNATRMKKQVIMVPVNNNGDPDYEYMEQYIKNMMLNKYQQNMKFKETR